MKLSRPKAIVAEVEINLTVVVEMETVGWPSSLRREWNLDLDNHLRTTCHWIKIHVESNQIRETSILPQSFRDGQGQAEEVRFL
jgi:hypothetical protein